MPTNTATILYKMYKNSVQKGVLIHNGFYALFVQKGEGVNANQREAIDRPDGTPC